MKRSSLLLIAMLGMMATPATADSKFETIPHSTTAVLSENTIQADVDAHVRANIAAGRASYDAIAKAGGCDAPSLPPTLYAWCWDRTVDNGPNPTGGPIGASMGGSD